MVQEHTRRLAAVWFADISGYTALSGRDEDAALAVVAELQALSTTHVERHGGRIVKFIGDAVLATFESTDSAARMVENRSDFVVRSIGTHEFKGVNRPIEVFTISEPSEEDMDRPSRARSGSP